MTKTKKVKGKRKTNEKKRVHNVFYLFAPAYQFIPIYLFRAKISKYVKHQAVGAAELVILTLLSARIAERHQSRMASYNYPQ